MTSPGDVASRGADPRLGGRRGGGGARTDLPSRAVLVRYQREDGRVHAVSLQQAGLADGRTHTALLRLRGPARPSPALQLYVDCKLGDQHAGLPALAPIPPAEVDGLEIRTGQKAYSRMQVSRREDPGGPGEESAPAGAVSHPPALLCSYPGLCGVHEDDSGRVDGPGRSPE